HLLGLGILGLECLALWHLARRWFCTETAAWALLCDLLCAATWMRSRSILSYHWLPLELLLLALLSGRVRGLGGAVGWGLLAALLLVDYEGAQAALPGLFIACLWKEDGFRRRWWAAGLSLSLAGALIAAAQPAVFGTYVRLRAAVNWGHDPSVVFTAWRINLWQLLAGGRPMPYLGVDHWPAVAAWSLPLLAWGAWTARAEGSLGVALWAISAVLITQAATAPWGLPSHRLAAAWPALCLLAGQGGCGLRRRFSRVPAALWIGLLLVGFLAEANAFYRHMAFHGREVYGRAELLAVAAHDARDAARDGAAVCTALMETRSDDLRFFVRPAPPARAGAPAWVFLPPEFHAVCASAGRALVYRSSVRDAPVLVLVAEGAQALRFERMEYTLRPLLVADSAGAEAAWLAHRGDDPWAYAAVLDRYLRRLWKGLPLSPDVVRLAALQPPLTPGPLSLLGRYFIVRSPQLAVRLLRRALVLDPWWAPALEDLVPALEKCGLPADARAAMALRDARLRAGAWRTYD
ncbi:MAG: hypothetical protein ACREKE_05760, partial [bacterium]